MPKGSDNMTTREKLQELQMTLPQAPAAVASYIPARKMGDLVYVSGQLPFWQGELMATGKLGELLEIPDGQELAKRCFFNALAAAAAIVDLDQITGVFRIGGWVACEPLFTDHALVLNGASEAAMALFGESGRHVRAAVGTNSLPMNSPVEVEVIFTLASFEG